MPWAVMSVCVAGSGGDSSCNYEHIVVLIEIVDQIYVRTCCGSSNLPELVALADT